MIETIHYDENAKAIIFDEPITEYYDILLQAASDNHYMSKNYRSDILSKFIYMVMWCYKGVPEIIYGIEKDPELPDNVARTLSRYYRIQNRRNKLPTTDSLVQQSLSFNSDFPEFHKKHGIDTLFYTRNYNEKPNKWLTRTTGKSGFKEIPGIKMYRGVPQHFWVKGNHQFLATLEEYTPSP